MELAKARTGQREAIRVIVGRVQDREPQTGIVLPTGYGKSDVIRASAVHLHDQKSVCCSLIVSPTAYLRDQLMLKEKLVGCLLRYDLPYNIKYSSIPNVAVNYAANGECLLSATIQLVQNNAENFAQWVQFMIRRTSLPVLIYVDETHTSTHRNQWGAALRKLQDAGALLVSLTATHFREDGAQIIGFAKRYVESEDVTVTKTRPGSAPDLMKVEIWEGMKHHYELEPDAETTFNAAWAEGVLCHIAHKTFDVTYNKETGDIAGQTAADEDRVPPGMNRERVLLSEMTVADTRRVLGRLVRHDVVIQHGVRELVHWLERMRAACPPRSTNCAGIVFTANDAGDDSNEHAERIKKEILKLKKWKVLIASSAETEGPRGKEVLERFVAGEGDVLIVKQMAGLGLDAPRLKVVLDLSPTRTPTAFIQRVNRATRPYEGILTAYLITPCDVLSLACFATLIAAEGGDTTTSEIELVEEYEVPRDEEPLPLFTLERLHQTNIDDTKGKTAHVAWLPQVIQFYEEFPSLVGVCTPGEVEERLKRLGVTLTHGAGSATDPQEEPINSGEQVASARGYVVELARNLVNLIFIQTVGRPYQKAPDDQARWAEISKALYRDAYQHCHVPFGTELKTITDLVLLNRIAEHFAALYERMREHRYETSSH